MSVHVKKCEPGPFQAVKDGSKPFEWRKEDDCRFEVDDLLVLLEHRRESDAFEPASYTGEVLKRRVTYVLRGRFGVPAGYVVLGLGPAFGQQDGLIAQATMSSKGLHR